MFVYTLKTHTEISYALLLNNLLDSVLNTVEGEREKKTHLLDEVSLREEVEGGDECVGAGEYGSGCSGVVQDGMCCGGGGGAWGARRSVRRTMENMDTWVWKKRRWFGSG